FCMYRGKPFVRTGKDIETVTFLISRTLTFNDGIVQNPASRFSYKRYLVPIWLGEIPGSIKVMACRCGIATMPIYLSQERCDVGHIIMGIYAVDRTTGCAYYRSFQVLIGHGQITTVLSVCCGNKDVKFFGKA